MCEARTTGATVQLLPRLLGDFGRIRTCRLEHDLSVVSPLLGDLPPCEPTVKVLGPDPDQLLDRPDQPWHNLGPLDDQRVLGDLQVVSVAVAVAIIAVAVAIIAVVVAVAIAVTLHLASVTVAVGLGVVGLGLSVVVVATTLYKIKGWAGMRVGREGAGMRKARVKARAMKLGDTPPRLCLPLCLRRSNENELTAGCSQCGIPGTLQRRVQRQLWQVRPPTLV